MLPEFPTIWLLLALPFISAIVFRQIPPLLRLTAAHYGLTMLLGIAGLAVLFAGALGLLPAFSELPLMLVGGMLGGLSMVSAPRGDEGTDPDDWRWRRRPPHDPQPEPTPGAGGADWASFDRIRAQWERDSTVNS
jgi:hypothetical protein